jgi:uncharacterized protein (TIGR03084 family)
MEADTIYADLEAELDRLEDILTGLDDAAWRSPSAAPGWSVADVMVHLAQTEEGVVATTSAGSARLGEAGGAGGATVDERMEIMVAAERAEPAVVFERWRVARRAALDAMRSADPQRRVAWAAWPLKPATLATTRLAEHWAHALDIVEPLAIPFPDTDRLRHVAWLGHGSLPYAFGLIGQPARAVRCELMAPDGVTVWSFGPADADSSIAGVAGAFCRVGAQRLTPAESGLVTKGPYGAAALGVLRNYAA